MITPFIMKSRYDNKGFITKWETTVPFETITLPLVESGPDYYFTVDWGDGSSDNITAWDDSAKTHAYTSTGEHTMEITGQCANFMFETTDTSAPKLKEIVYWGDYPKFHGFWDFQFWGCVNMELNSNSGSILIGNSITNYPFDTCVSITSVPVDFFKLMGKLNSISSNGMFYGTGLTSLPDGLFKDINNQYGFSLAGCFSGCPLTSIPANLFENSYIYFIRGCFSECTSLTSLPVVVFKDMEYLTRVDNCFYGCTSLEEIPSTWISNSPNIENFSYTFANCVKLELSSDIFTYANLLDKSVDFEQCFYRDSFTGTQGTAPDLWNVNYGTGTPTTTNCFGGAGNSATSISNYTSIPSAWK